jgi:hypothetical protein
MCSSHRVYITIMKIRLIREYTACLLERLENTEHEAIKTTMMNDDLNIRDLRLGSTQDS